MTFGCALLQYFENKFKRIWRLTTILCICVASLCRAANLHNPCERYFVQQELKITKNECFILSYHIVVVSNRCEILTFITTISLLSISVFLCRLSHRFFPSFSFSTSLYLSRSCSHSRSSSLLNFAIR